METMKIKLAVLVIYFLILYLIAFINNKDYKEPEDFLGVTDTQWTAIMVMWAPSILIFTK